MCNSVYNTSKSETAEEQDFSQNQSARRCGNSERIFAPAGVKKQFLSRNHGIIRKILFFGDLKIMKGFLHNFKIQADIWLFYAFLVTFTLTFRKVLFFYPIGGVFNEWSGAYLYISDIFLLIALIAWAVIVLYNKISFLSIKVSVLWLKKAYIYLPLFLVVWSFFSIFWSENQNIALFKAIKLLEMYFLYLFIVFRIFPLIKKPSHAIITKYAPHPSFIKSEGENVPRGTIAKNILGIFIILGFIQAIIGIFQFILQRSIGLFWFFESYISPDIDGVAKIVINGEKYIRAYGLFPHPNILGGFFLVSLVLTWGYKKMLHVRPAKCSTWNIFNEWKFTLCWKNLKGLIKELIKKLLTPTDLKIAFLLIIQAIALILTFSKSAILGLLVAFGYILWKNKKMFHVEHFTKKAAICSIILFLSLYLIGLNFSENLSKSLDDRYDQLKTWMSTVFNESLITGLGIGNYMFHVEHSHPNLETWQYQPVHNIFLLIQAELGFIAVFIFVLLLIKMFHVEHFFPFCPKYPASLIQCEPKSQIGVFFPVLFWNIACKAILIGFIVIMFFDHYFWSIQQGQIALWLILGFIAGYGLYESKNESD